MLEIFYFVFIYQLEDTNIQIKKQNISGENENILNK